MTILKELYKAIIDYTMPAKKKLTKLEFMTYLIIENLETSKNPKEDDKIKNFFCDNFLYDLYHGTKRMSYKNLNSLYSCENSGTKKLAGYIFRTVDVHAFLVSANNILNKILGHQTPPRTNEPSLKNIYFTINLLISLHFLAMLYSDKQNASSKKYIHWEAMEQQIDTILKQQNHLILSGNPGSGKKELLKNTLTNIYWLDTSIPVPLKNFSINLPFFDRSYSLNICQFLNLLKYTKSTPILVIDRPALTDEDLSFYKESLFSTEFKSIIITYRRTFSKAFTVLDINKRPAANLIKVFHAYNPASDFTDEEIQTLLKIISGNVYVLILIAHALSIKSNTLTKDMLLNTSEWIWYKHKTPKMHSSYHNPSTKPQQLLLNLIERILSNYNLGKHTSELSIWTKTPICRELLISEWPENTIDDCITYGILQYYDEDKTKLLMPRLISDAIWKQCPIDYEDYKEKIFAFLSDIEYGKKLSIPYTDLYQIIFNMILRFHFQVTTMPSRINKNTESNFEEWNILLTDIIERYMKLGNYQYAQKVLPYLYAARTKRGENITPSTLQSSIRELLSKQANYMQSNDITNELDELIQLIMSYKKQSNLPQHAHEGNIILHLCSLICKDITDHAINTTLKLVSEKHMTDNWLNGLNKLSILFTDKEDYYHHLLMLIYHYASAIVKPNDLQFHLHEINVHKKLLFYKGDISYESFQEIVFRINGLYIYFNTIFILQYEDYMEPESKTKAIEVLETKYNNLYSQFKNSIRSYHASFVFYSCTFLLAQYLLPYFSNPSTYKNLEDIIKQFTDFNQKQLSLDLSIVNEYVTYTTYILNDLHAYMSRKAK